MTGFFILSFSQSCSPYAISGDKRIIMSNLIHQELTGAIIGAYYEVYNHTSRTYPEYIYERAMMEELRRRDMPTTRQDEYRIIYKDKLVGLQRLDLFVVQEIAVEIKVAEELTRLHKAQTISYLKVVDKPVGLLLNFGKSEPELNRLYFNPAKNPQPQLPPNLTLRPTGSTRNCVIKLSAACLKCILY